MKPKQLEPFRRLWRRVRGGGCEAFIQSAAELGPTARSAPACRTQSRLRERGARGRFIQRRPAKFLRASYRRTPLLRCAAAGWMLSCSSAVAELR